MAKTNPLKADRIGPLATVYIDGVPHKATRPTSMGWELQSTGANPRIEFLSHRDLEQGQQDGTIVIKRPKGEDPSLASQSLKQRRDIFIKDWWMRRLVNGLKNGTVASTGDVALNGFIEVNYADLVRDLHAWSQDADYDHAAAREAKPRKPHVGTETEHFELAPCSRHMRRLLARYLAHDQHPISMRKRTERSDKGGVRVDDRVVELARAKAIEYAGEANPTMVELHKLVKAIVVERNKGLPEELHLKAPCKRTIERLIGDLPEAQKIGARKRPRSVAVALGPYGKGPTYHRVGERCEIDCWNIPLFVLLTKAGVASEIPDNIAHELLEKSHRIHVAVVVDSSTGYILGICFGLSESAELTTAALKMALIDKTRYSNWAGCERPWNLYTGIEECGTDAGPGFQNDRFLSAVIPAVNSHVYAASGLPHLRGLIESVFSTLHKGFISKFVARAFENVVAKGDYEAEKRANLPLEEFLRLMVRYVVDVYHHELRNGGLRKSPHHEFEDNAAAMEPKAPAHPDEIRVWFGFEAERKTGPHGVRFMHIDYDSDWLVKYRYHMGLEKVMIRVDEDDIGAISVLLDGDWISVPARDPEFKGVSLEEWTSLIRDLRKRFGVEAEIDFERYVAPALLDIERTSRKAEKAMKLRHTFWSDEKFKAFEDQSHIRFVNRDTPANMSETPSFGQGTIGRRFARQVDATRPPAPPAETPVTAPDQPEAPKVSAPTRKRRLTYRED